MVRNRVSTDLLFRARTELRDVEQSLRVASTTSYRVWSLSIEARRPAATEAIIPSLVQMAAANSVAELEALTHETARLSADCADLADRLAVVQSNTVAAEDRLETLFRAVRQGVSRGISSPAFVQSLRAVASGVDGVTAGVVYGPLGTLWQVFRGKPGPDYTARLLAQFTGSGNAPSAPLSVRQVSTSSVAAPRSLADVAERIPEARAGQPQVRIERYGHPEHPTWIVYSSGTIDLSLNSPSEPWDLSSNLDAMATGTSESIQATERAMALAGIDEQASVLHVGFSQGGLVAAHVALSDERAPASLITFGAPVAHLDFASLEHAVLVEHAEDLVPALGGEHPSRDDGRVLVTTALRDRLEYDRSVPAHDMGHYAQTLHDAEAKASPALARAQLTLRTTFEGSGTMTTWRAERARAN